MPTLNVVERALVEARPAESMSGHGRGFLQIDRRGALSTVRRAFATSPLRLLLPRNHGAAAWVYTSSYGGGLVDGDALQMDVRVGPGAMAFLSTQASTKVYRSPRGTSVDGSYHIDRGGLLVVAPDPVVCFAHATYRQQQRFEIGPDAGLVLVDCIAAGRRAAGERWAFDRYSSTTTIACEGRSVLYDALSLTATDGSIPDRLGRFNAICSIAVFGARLRVHAARLLAAVAETPVEQRADIVVGASAVGDGATLLRMAGVSTEHLCFVAREYLSFVAPLLGDDPWTRRW